MKSTTSGLASTFAPRIKKIKRQHSPNATQNLTLAILQPIYSMRRDQPTTAYSSHVDAALMALTVVFIIKFLA